MEQVGQTTDLNLGTARYRLGGAGSNNTSALAFGGTPPTSKQQPKNGTQA